MFALSCSPGKPVVPSWLLMKFMDKVQTHIRVFVVCYFIKQSRNQNYVKYFWVFTGCFPHQKSFLVYLCLTCSMNIELSTGLQANILGNELISNIFAASCFTREICRSISGTSYFIFLIFEIVGLLVIIIVPNFQFLFSLFLIFLKCISKCSIMDCSIGFTRKIVGKDYEHLGKVFSIYVHTQHCLS